MQKKITEKRLLNGALFYLERTDVSVEKMRSVLKRRILKNKEESTSLSDEEKGMVDRVILKLQDLGFLNDERYALNLIRRLSEQGKSVRFMGSKLRQNGIDEELIECVFEEQRPDEMVQAKLLVKKRKMGLFRADPESFYQKDLGRLARAGFSYETARQVLNLPPEDF